ncbi:MAG: four helix bundle protein [Bacteroidales bacterium]|nr:four helix bundle protein [Bacteroidales bacterium]MBN2758263.1 four helix bundle protein [Bacteroidales bacterium]
MKLDELNVYKLSMDIGERIWDFVNKWNYFEKDTIGKQLVRAIDSVAANLSEGFGRFHYKEKKNFNYYSRGSLYESKTWITKAKNRGLISEDDFLVLKKEINTIGKMLNSYNKSIGTYPTQGTKQVKEPEVNYYPIDDDIFED